LSTNFQANDYEKSLFPSQYRNVFATGCGVTLRPLLDSLFGYNGTKVKGENIHKTTFITNCDTMPYKCQLFSLLDTGTAFKKTMHMTLDELVSLHLYLDELIVRVKGMMITLDF
jgi:hypothetical protein